ncbi:hypothetical protein Si021_01388 [Streptococcus infantarius subsp. infantarius]|nr:hypothetical protein [Streptococcus infantarius subsp. infantarius]
MRGETQKEILILKQKRGTTILNIFLTKSQELFLKKVTNILIYGMISVEIEERDYANTVKAT